VVPIYNGILLNNNRNKIRPFAATSMDLEIIILSEVRQRQMHACIFLNYGFLQTYAQSGINLKNKQRAHVAIYQKNKQPNQKMGRRSKKNFSKEDRLMAKKHIKYAQHH